MLLAQTKTTQLTQLTLIQVHIPQEKASLLNLLMAATSANAANTNTSETTAHPGLGLTHAH